MHHPSSVGRSVGRSFPAKIENIRDDWWDAWRRRATRAWDAPERGRVVDRGARGGGAREPRETRETTTIPDG